MIEQALIKTLGFEFPRDTFIQKAFEGGFVCCKNEVEVQMEHVQEAWPAILLSPAAWKACGKTEGWHQSCVANSHEGGCEMCWQKGMHSFISVLAEEESSKA